MLLTTNLQWEWPIYNKSNLRDVKMLLLSENIKLTCSVILRPCPKIWEFFKFRLFNIYSNLDLQTYSQYDTPTLGLVIV